MRASRHRRRALETESRRAAIMVTIAAVLLALVGFAAHFLRQRGWLGRGRRERH